MHDVGPLSYRLAKGHDAQDAERQSHEEGEGEGIPPL